MRELVNKIINLIKEYAKEQGKTECEILSLVICDLINVNAMSYIQPIIIKEKE